MDGYRAQRGGAVGRNAHGEAAVGGAGRGVAEDIGDPGKTGVLDEIFAHDADVHRDVLNLHADTGGSRGIGLAIAKRLADEGARVAIAARTGVEADRAASEIVEGGGEALAIACDVRRGDDVARLREERYMWAGRANELPRASFGIAWFPVDGRDADALISTADARMYEDKAGR